MGGKIKGKQIFVCYGMGDHVLTTQRITQTKHVIKFLCISGNLLKTELFEN